MVALKVRTGGSKSPGIIILDIENDYRTMRAELQSNIRNPLSCIKASCFLINSLAEKENIQSEKLQEYLQIIEKAAEDIESTLK